MKEWVIRKLRRLVNYNSIYFQRPAEYTLLERTGIYKIKLHPGGDHVSTCVIVGSLRFVFWRLPKRGFTYGQIR